MLAFQQTVFCDIAALQTAAGLRPFLQMGEFLWWYFSEPGGIASMAYYDAATSAAALPALDRSLYVFGSPNDNPGVNSSADAIFLRDRLRDHVAALVSGVRAVYPTARFEVLLPLDVNYPTPVGPTGAQVGGRLNNFVNIPTEWVSSTTAGFDFLKIEALSFGSSLRNLNLAQSAMTVRIQLNWPGDPSAIWCPSSELQTPGKKKSCWRCLQATRS